MKLDRYLLPATLVLLLGAVGAQANDNRSRDKDPQTTSTTGTQSQHPATGVHGRTNAQMQQEDHALFGRLDTNSDGYLSDAELKADTSVDLVFGDVDRDSDSRISRGEWQSRDARGQQNDDEVAEDNDE